MMTIKVLRRHEPTGLLEGMRCAYAGEVPLRVWLRLYRRVIKLDRQGYFFPMDALDVYGEVALKLEHLASEKPEVENLEAYLMGVLNRSLLSYHLRKVRPKRHEDAQVGRLVAQLDDVELTARDLAEALPGIPGAEERRTIARKTLEEIFTELEPEPVNGFRAFIAADCNKEVACVLIGMSRRTYFRKWPLWVSAAREVAA